MNRAFGFVSLSFSLCRLGWTHAINGKRGCVWVCVGITLSRGVHRSCIDFQVFFSDSFSLKDTFSYSAFNLPSSTCFNITFSSYSFWRPIEAEKALPVFRFRLPNRNQPKQTILTFSQLFHFFLFSEPFKKRLFQRSLFTNGLRKSKFQMDTSKCN